MERSKVFGTANDMNILGEWLQKMDFVDLCSLERPNTNYNCYKITTLKALTSLDDDVSIGVKACTTRSAYEKPQCEMCDIPRENEITLQL